MVFGGIIKIVGMNIFLFVGKLFLFIFGFFVEFDFLVFEYLVVKVVVLIDKDIL